MWKYYKDDHMIESKYGHAIDLEPIERNDKSVLIWLDHFMEKDWATPEVMYELIRLMCQHVDIYNSSTPPTRGGDCSTCSQRVQGA